jgi:hypothetical protein
VNYFLVAQNIFMPLQRNPFFGPAITAMQIAPVGYGNAQVIYFSVEFIEHDLCGPSFYIVPKIAQ